MQIRTTHFHLTKRHPLTISRGTSDGSENLLVEVTHDGITGLGEMAPFNLGNGLSENAVSAQADITRWAQPLVDVAPWEMQRVESTIDAAGGGGAGARAALIAALYDWLGKRAAMPVYQLLGADLQRIVPTSVTVGINPPEIVREHVREWLVYAGAQCLKVKLGSPEGLEVDREIFIAVQESVLPGVRLRVDANGGWTVPEAREMLHWLAERGVEYVEQPLPRGQESDLSILYRDAPLPIFVDESCLTPADVPKLADRVHGINLKLMKVGGIREGLRMISTARAHGLQVMMGCMSESSLAIASSAHMAAFADFLDLDSHLNLLQDPFTGLQWENGRVLPSEQAGLGIAFV
jgi:L-alanine-DL-glutamate epimerase-like enolase superfamily enzyme